MARWLIVVAACGLSLAAAAAVAQECPEIVAILPYGEPDVVAVEGSYAYLGIGRGLLVVDESDPSDLRTAARLAMPGTVRGIAVAAGRAYVTLGEDGLRVVDVSDTTDPSIVQTVGTPGEAQGVKVVGDLLFVASGSAGLCAVSPTADPPLLGCLDTPGDARDVDVAGILAVVADGPGGLVVVSITDPTQMTVRSVLPMEARAVAMEGDTAFVACGDAGLRVVEVPQTGLPLVVGELATLGAEDLDVDGDLAVIAARYSYSSSAGLRVVDVSAPTAPVQIGSLSLPGVTQESQVVLRGECATLGEGGYGVTLVDLSAPTVPVESGRLPTGVFDRVEANGQLAVIGKVWGPHASVVDLSQPNRPRELSVLHRFYGWPAALSGSWLFLSTARYGPPSHYELQVLDLSEPAHPTVVATHELPDYGELMTRSGDMLQVMDGSGDIHLIDVTTPWAPVEVGLIPSLWGWYTYYQTDAIAAIPGYVFRGGLAMTSPPPPWYLGWHTVEDITDPSHPTSTPLYQMEPDIPGTMLVEDRTLVVAGGNRFGEPAVALYDLTEPTAPHLTGGGVSGWVASVAMSHHGQVLLLSEPDDQLVRAIDLHAPWDPAGIAEVSLPAPGGLASRGRYLLVADEELGLVVLDTTCVGGLFADGFESGGTAAWSEVWP